MMFTVSAGFHDRLWCPVTAPLAAPQSGIKTPVMADQDTGQEIPAQLWQRLPSGQDMVSWIIPELHAGASRRFRLVDRGRPWGPQELVSLGIGDTKVQVRLGSQHLTTYNFGPEVVRPYLYPVYAGGQIGITRNWPMVADAQGETGDHPHHKGIYTAHGEVNGVDNWGDGDGRQTHRGFVRTFEGPVDAGLVQNLDWVDKTGAVAMKEIRVIRFYGEGPATRIMDYEVSLHASEGRVVLGDTKEAGLLSIRVATTMDAARENGGTITNGFGGINETETWGKPAPWCDYTGPVGDTACGVSFMDHPENPRHPTPWHVRDYGLMSANCFGYHHFKGRDDARRDYVIEKGTTATWRYRILIHTGSAVQAKIGDRYMDYAFPPLITQEND